MLLYCNHNLLKPEWATVQHGGIVKIEEKSEGGRGIVYFHSSVTTLHLRHFDNKPPLKWARNGRCADGAIIAETDTGLCLHVVELKKKVNRGEWLTIKQQFEGMIANAIAALAVVGGPRPDKIVCHVSYEMESVSGSAVADTVLLKMPIGGTKPFVQTEDWDRSKVNLFGFVDVPLRKIVRDAASGEGVGDLAEP